MLCAVPALTRAAAAAAEAAEAAVVGVAAEFTSSDMVVINRRTDQRWKHGIPYGAAEGQFRASIVMTLSPH